MVLIESSQTIKIVIEKLTTSATFNFSSDSLIFTDSGAGEMSNSMTLTLAIQPTYCNETGIAKIKINSIVAQIFDQDKHKFVVNTTTIPMRIVGDFIENWRQFIIKGINDLAKIFNSDIENLLNVKYAYSTDRSVDPNTPCQIESSTLIKLCPLASPIHNISRILETTSVCMCHNLIDYREKIYNPSIRDDFISTRIYGMSFAPNRSENIEKSLINRTELKYMPTYEESNKDIDLLQLFISEDVINSLILSYSDEGLITEEIVMKKSMIGNTDCYTIAKLFFKSTSMAKNCYLNIFLSKFYFHLNS